MAPKCLLMMDKLSEVLMLMRRSNLRLRFKQNLKRKLKLNQRLRVKRKRRNKRLRLLLRSIIKIRRRRLTPNTIKATTRSTITNKIETNQC